MTKYTRITGKYNTTEALRTKLQLCRQSVIEAKKDLRNMQTQNQKRLVMFHKIARSKKGKPGYAMARAEIVNVIKRSHLRLKPFEKSILTETKKLKAVESRIRRSQKQGKIYKIL